MTDAKWNFWILTLLLWCLKKQVNRAREITQFDLWCACWCEHTHTYAKQILFSKCLGIVYLTQAPTKGCLPPVRALLHMEICSRPESIRYTFKYAVLTQEVPLQACSPSLNNDLASLLSNKSFVLSHRNDA